MSYGEWAPYVPVAKRRARAAREISKLLKKGTKIEPIEVQGRKISRTFWGEAWCSHLEKFSDYENRLPRGRTYIRNGSVCHLSIAKGKVEAMVSGSDLYRVTINVSPISARKWKILRSQCTGQIGSMLELLRGRFSDHIMRIVTDQDQGLFPKPDEIKLACDCPDWAGMCKHVAAVLYGVGVRLDCQPELLFLLRDVDYEELITAELDIQSATAREGKRRRLARTDLADVFGLDMGEPVTLDSENSAIRKMAVKKRTKTFSPTAAMVTRLRKKFGMNTSQFAKLVGVSPPTVNSWENGRGKLKLHQRSLEALGRVAEYTPEQAANTLSRDR